MSNAVSITPDDLSSLKRHMDFKEWDYQAQFVEALNIRDVDEKNALLALAMCEYELLAKSAAYRNETEIRPSVEALCGLYAATDFDNTVHREAWIQNAARIIHDSQTFIMYRHGENAQMQEFYRTLVRDHGHDDTSEEAQVQIGDVAEQAKDFWAVLTKLRARTGMPAAMVDYTGYPIDPAGAFEAGGQS